MRLLAQPAMTVAQTASQTGFGSPAHFVSSFRRHNGITPGAFRTTMLNSVHKQYRRWTVSGLWDLMLDAGEAHDSTAFTDLMAEHDADPEVMLADKGYDSDAIRDDVRARGGTPEIPTKKSRRVQHTVNRALYATRNRIERFFNRLKNSRRVAT